VCPLHRIAFQPAGTRISPKIGKLQKLAQLIPGKTTMNRRLISTGSNFEKTAGYSRAVVQGDWCFVSGTTGYNYQSMHMPDSIESQTRNCLATIESVLQDAGFTMSEVVRANYYITNQAFADLVFPILGEAFGEIRPAATMIVCGLIKPEMKIEIQVTALKVHARADKD
jgi:enamine deaminase RidA (YjgF/YER057c/UK114 family)